VFSRGKGRPVAVFGLPASTFAAGPSAIPLRFIVDPPPVVEPPPTLVVSLPASVFSAGPLPGHISRRSEHAVQE
jgi:hypothetical protein